MKSITPILWLLSMLMTSCAQKEAPKTVSVATLTDTLVEIPADTIEQAKLVYKNNVSLWTLNGQPYSGYAISHYPNGTLKKQFGIFEGKKQNQARHWHPDGHLQRVAHFHKGKLHGEKKTWSSDDHHHLIAHLNYQFGRPHGEQKQWYATGELYKKLNLKEGKEEGLQQAFRKNGALYANYEARNGRIFGLKKATLCYGLDNETLQYEK